MNVQQICRCALCSGCIAEIEIEMDVGQTSVCSWCLSSEHFDKRNPKADSNEKCSTFRSSFK